MVESYLKYLEAFMETNGSVNRAQALQLIAAVREGNTKIEELKAQLAETKVNVL